jgi:ABC-type multidrug transport system fused ATPase/permease subunit
VALNTQTCSLVLSMANVVALVGGSLALRMSPQPSSTNKVAAGMLASLLVALGVLAALLTAQLRVARQFCTDDALLDAVVNGMTADAGFLATPGVAETAACTESHDVVVEERLLAVALATYFLACTVLAYGMWPWSASRHRQDSQPDVEPLLSGAASRMAMGDACSCLQSCRSPLSRLCGAGQAKVVRAVRRASPGRQADQVLGQITPPAEMRVELHGMTYEVSSGSRSVAIGDITAAFLPGTVTALMGLSGAGKSTLLKVGQGTQRYGI